MTNNDILRSIRYLLAVNDLRMAEITSLAGAQIPVETISSFLKNEEDEGYLSCGHEELALFLNGFIISKRGRDESKPLLPPEKIVTNNTVLKKLRVAFQFKDEDILEILSQAGFNVSKGEINALFRKEDHPNFRLCGDQLLRNFFKGLALKFRG